MDPHDHPHKHPLGIHALHPSRDAQGPAVANGRRPGAPPAEEDLDALADLFLGPSDTGEHAAAAHHPAPQPPARPRIEAVVLGHLPVSASAWPGQYARRRAEQLARPVAVLRRAAGSLVVDLLGADAPDQPLTTEREAIEFVRAGVGTIILRVDEPDEAQLATLPALDSLCLLTGADDAAVVACYRKLKHLAAAAEGAGLPDIHLAVMGATPTGGALAHDRISRAARAFLDADLLEPIIIDRIGPTGMTTVYQAPTDLSLVALGSLLAQPRSMPRASRATPTVPTLEAVAQSRPEIAPGPAAERHGLPDPHPMAPDRLCSLIKGLSPIESRCPLAERIELAGDAAGRLHLVAARLDTHPDLSPADPVGELLRAAAWARANATLLAKAERSLVAGADPALHLVTDQAGLAVALLDTPIVVHLAMPAAPAAFGLVAAPLQR